MEGRASKEGRGARVVSPHVLAGSSPDSRDGSGARLRYGRAGVRPVSACVSAAAAPDALPWSELQSSAGTRPALTAAVATGPAIAAAAGPATAESAVGAVPVSVRRRARLPVRRMQVESMTRGFLRSTVRGAAARGAGAAAGAACAAAAPTERCH